MSKNKHINPQNVREILSKHILTDGMEMVLDLHKSKGPYLYDAKEERNRLDFFTFFASNPLGMNHPSLVDDQAFREKIGFIALQNPSNSDIYTQEMAEFVDTFSRIGIPDYLPHAFFIAGGGLAVENALKAAFDWKVQKNFEKGYRVEKGHKVLHFEEAFHGRTGYTMSMTNSQPIKTRFFPKFDWPRVSNPKMFFPMDEHHTALVEENEKKSILQAERHFEENKDDIAAIIIEPIQGEGGDNHFRPEFHQALRDMADRHEALLIYDEVQTGVGITGKFWAHEHYVKPDIMAFGKKAQICGMLASKRIDEVEHNVFTVDSRLNSTWGGNLVDMIRFTKYLEVIRDDKLVENAAEKGAYLKKSISNLVDEFDFLHNARGKGLMCAFNFKDEDARAPFLKRVYANGVTILPSGKTTIRFRPPLTIEEAHIDEGMDIIRKSLKETWEQSAILRARYQG